MYAILDTRTLIPSTLRRRKCKNCIYITKAMVLLTLTPETGCRVLIILLTSTVEIINWINWTTRERERERQKKWIIRKESKKCLVKFTKLCWMQHQNWSFYILRTVICHFGCAYSYSDMHKYVYEYRYRYSLPSHINIQERKKMNSKFVTHKMSIEALVACCLLSEQRKNQNKTNHRQQVVQEAKRTQHRCANCAHQMPMTLKNRSVNLSRFFYLNRFTSVSLLLIHLSTYSWQSCAPHDVLSQRIKPYSETTTTTTIKKRN